MDIGRYVAQPLIAIRAMRVHPFRSKDLIALRKQPSVFDILQCISPLDIREISEEAVDLFTPAAEDRRIHIHLSKPPQAVMLFGDRQRLQRVVANLLDNAIKYTPHGGKVTLSITAEAAGAKVKITDTGVGIDEKDIHRIFDRFYRGDKSRSTAGSGLGLSLALAIVRAHGGDITVKTTDSGSTFTASLPNKPSFG